MCSLQKISSYVLTVIYSRPSLLLKKAFSKTYPSFLTLKEGSTSHLGLLPSGKKRKTALRCSEPLRFMVVGPSKVCAMLCGIGPPGDELGLSLDRLAYKDGYNDYMMLVLW